MEATINEEAGLAITCVQPEISFDDKVLEAQVRELVAPYEGIDAKALAQGDLKEAKALRADLRKMSKALNDRRNPDGSVKPLVAILWGRKAQTLEPLLTNAFIIKSPHPSPMSARYGFFGSKPFSRANQALVDAGVEPVNWSLPSA